MNTIISQRAAQVVTTSWGQCEELEGFGQASSENNLFQEAAAQGMTIVSASGDDGSEDCFPTPPTLQVDDPASQPFVTSVGGTTLTANATTGARLGETVWNDGPSIGASGGGLSSFWPMPAYQKDAPSSVHVINGNSSGTTCSASSGDCREVPDVSADGDPNTGYVIYWNGSGTAVAPATKGWQVVGGTSAAAPAWAALIALTNASATCAGTPIGFANPALYHAAATAYSSDFNDVTSGNNDMTGAFGLYPAGSGYDMATGLGSPNGTALAQALCTDAITLANPGSQRSTVKTSVSLQIRAADTRGAAVTYKATGLPSGLTINGSTGKISGHPKRIEKSTVTISVADAVGTTAETTFAWTIQGTATLSHLSLSSVGVARPRLSFTLTAGRERALDQVDQRRPPARPALHDLPLDGHRHRRQGQALEVDRAARARSARAHAEDGYAAGARDDLLAAPSRQRQPDRGARPPSDDPGHVDDPGDGRRQADDAPVAEDQAELIRRPPAEPVPRCSASRRRPGS